MTIQPAYKTCHGYDAISGEYTGEQFAFLSPAEGKYPLPAHAVWERPLYPAPAGSAWVMSQQYTWELIEDNRGTVFYLNGVPYKMETLGPLPDGAQVQKAGEAAPGDVQETSAEDTMRKERDRLLAASDVLALRYLELGQAVPEALVKYRQELRDMPLSEDWPNVAFPILPELTTDGNNQQ